MTYNAHKKAAWVLTVTAINHITSCGWWDHLLSDNAVFFFQHLLWVFLCTVLLRTSRCQAMGEHDSPSEDKFTSTSFFFSWNLSYALRDGTSVAIQQPSRKLPRERQTCQQQEGEEGGNLALVLEMNPVCLGFHLWPDKRTSCLLWDGLKGKIRPSGY